MRKILFLPNDLGGGVGHVRRSVQIANLLRDRNWETAFVIQRGSTEKQIPATHQCFHLPINSEKYYVGLRAPVSPIHFRPKESFGETPFFWEFASLNYQALRDGYFDQFIVERRLKKLSKIVTTWKPDLLIGDGHLLTYFLGRIHSIPVLQIVRYFVFPESPNFIWWKDAPAELIPPRFDLLFEDLFEKSGLEAANEVSKFLCGDAYLIPATPEIEPIDTESPYIFFSQSMEGIGSENLNDQPKEDKPRIFVTIGGGAHRTRVDILYETIYSALLDSPYQVLISDPLNLLSDKPLRAGMRIEHWVNTSEVYPQTDAIIHHGGYQTTIESLRWGIPSIIIPSHSEQEGNGRRIELLNTGRVLLAADPPYEPVRFSFHTGEFTMLGGFRFSLTEEIILSTIEQILMNENFKEAAVKQGQRLADAHSPEQMIEFIERMMVL